MAWQEDRLRLNHNVQHLPFIENLTPVTRGEDEEEEEEKLEEAKSEPKCHHFRSACELCGRKTTLPCQTCGAYLCVKGKYIVGIHKVTCWTKFHSHAKL